MLYKMHAVVVTHNFTSTDYGIANTLLYYALTGINMILKTCKKTSQIKRFAQANLKRHQEDGHGQ